MDTTNTTTTRSAQRKHTAAPAAEPASTNPTTNPTVNPSTTLPAASDLIDPYDPHIQAQIAHRYPSGSYEITEIALVLAIRAWERHGDLPRARALSETLVDRCMPEFQRRSWGLRHRPQLMEDAISGMIEQLLREARNPAETFMTLNFIHYLRCLCADNFSRVLRQEGLSYRRDEQGRPIGHPQHIPNALLDHIDPAAENNEDAASGPGAPIVPDPRDNLEERMSALEAQRILSYLRDPLDRQIMALRALERMRWDDIAKLCGKTERTMRLRYEKAVVTLRQCIEAETTAIAR